MAVRRRRPSKRIVFYLLDRYFPTVPVFKELNAQNAVNRRKVDIISRMKRSTVAYRTPLPAKPGQRGRKAAKGEKVRLADLFETEKASFRTKKMNLYGKKQSVRYYAVDLLWGQGLYQKLRFVLVECDGSRVILVRTNLNLYPPAIIRLYGYRFRIESMFREFVNFGMASPSARGNKSTLTEIQVHCHG